MSELENTPDAIVVQVDSSVKPPPIIVQMESIAPEPITMGGDIVFKHDWYRLINSAPFQMYCNEFYGDENRGSHNIEEWIRDAIESHVLADEDGFFKKYSEWHFAKGYWKNETVYGDLIDEANTN